jgi:2-polyprenyl-3-methyl-5-hydroxy-6-metoxy-1,4-benzoquinol methylase
MSVAESAPLIYIGDKLGLYRAMAGAGPLTSQELAERSGTHERYVREWLNNRAAGGIVEYHPADGTYELSDEAAQLWAEETSPAFLAGWIDLIASVWADADRVAGAFRSGEGILWGDHDPRLYRGVQRFFSPLYRGSLVQEWIPSLDGVDDKLRRGAKVADVGCGYGISTVIMAEAYPRSSFVGYDSHPESITAAEKAAAEEWRTGCASRSPTPPPSTARGTTWSASSTPSTTWATRWARRPTPGLLSPRAAP